MRKHSSNQNRSSEPTPALAHREQLRFERAYEISVDSAEAPESEALAEPMGAPPRPSHPTPGSKGRAVGYIRVSTEDQTKGYSLDAQRSEIDRYCERKGYELVRIYADEGSSAHTDRLSKRPELTRLLNHAEQGEFDVVIVHTLDRWARNMRVHVEALQTLSDADVGFVSVTEDIDFSTPIGRVIISVLAAFAELFSAQLGAHVAKSVRQRAEEGFQNGSIPFGYRKDDESGIPCPVPEEAEAIRTAFVKRVAGETQGAIARWLNAQGFRTRQDNLFTDHAVRDMLSFRFYLGVVTLKGEEFPGQHDGIIDLDLFERVQTRIVKRGPGKRTMGSPRGVLAGLIRCGRCGKRIQADSNRVGTPMYRERHSTECETNRRSRVARHIDSQIAEIFGSLVLPQDWKQNIARQSVKTEGPSVSDLQRRRLKLGRSYRDETITEEEYSRELEELDAQLRMAQISTPIELDDVSKLLQDLPSLWSDATMDERRRLLRTLVEAVYVDIGARRVVGIAPVAALRTLVESGIDRIAGCPAVLIDPDEVGETQSMELVETGENRTPRPASLRHGSATGVVSSRFSPASHR